MNNKEYEKILLCPGCHGEIRISDKIVCGNPGCKREYNIIDDIPIMVLGQAEKVKQEIIQAKTQNKGIFNKKIFGIPYYKVDYTIKKNLYNLFGIKLPKLKDQRDYWLRRGNEYCNEFQKKGYETLEIFFQDLAIKELKKSIKGQVEIKTTNCEKVFNILRSQLSIINMIIFGDKIIIKDDRLDSASFKNKIIQTIINSGEDVLSIVTSSKSFYDSIMEKLKK